MIADIIILAAVLSYCGFVLRRHLRNKRMDAAAAEETAAAVKRAVITEKRNRKAGMTMTDVIILLIILMVLIYGVKGTVKHFKGEEHAAEAAAAL